MIKGVNDTVLHARLLVKRLRGVQCNVNLIEYNPHSGCDLQAERRRGDRAVCKCVEGGGHRDDCPAENGTDHKRRLRTAGSEFKAEKLNVKPKLKAFNKLVNLVLRFELMIRNSILPLMLFLTCACNASEVLQFKFQPGDKFSLMSVTEQKTLA